MVDDVDVIFDGVILMKSEELCENGFVAIKMLTNHMHARRRVRRHVVYVHTTKGKKLKKMMIEALVVTMLGQYTSQ